MIELSLKPQNINEQCWYYEESGGIEIIQELLERPGHPMHIKISWRKLVASVGRYQAVKAARPNKRIQPTAQVGSKSKRTSKPKGSSKRRGG